MYGDIISSKQMKEMLCLQVNKKVYLLQMKLSEKVARKCIKAWTNLFY
jgi:hypothetical protein